MNVYIRSNDGEFDVLPSNEYPGAPDKWHVHSIQDNVYEAWLAHVKAHVAWNDFWIELKNAESRRREALETVWVVFTIPGVGEVRRGPFHVHEDKSAAVIDRELARQRYDKNAYFLTNAGTYPQELP